MACLLARDLIGPGPGTASAGRDRKPVARGRVAEVPAPDRPQARRDGQVVTQVRVYFTQTVKLKIISTEESDRTEPRDPTT